MRKRLLKLQGKTSTDAVVTTRKPSIGAIGLAVLMLFFGSLMFLFGCAAVWEWRAESDALVACGVLWLLSGPMIVGSALWLFGSLGRSRRALRVGGGAIIATGVILAAAAATHIMPCSGPA